jgi:DNA (cytosine-5)-methyltransferase 1
MKPRLLDLFCGAGGAAMGYHRAGFEVVGVDIKPQPRYPFEFHQADAMTYPLEGFDAIHASPPCQAFSAMKTMPNAKEHFDLLTPTRERLKAWGGPYAIENVEGAPMFNYITLCGTSFGLGVAEAGAELRRHRRFEMNPEPELMVPPCAHGGRVIGVYGGHGRDRRRIRPATVGVYGSAGGMSVRDGTQQFSTEERREAMGIDWMTGAELSQAIPPAYTEFIGRQLIRATPEARIATGLGDGVL